MSWQLRTTEIIARALTGMRGRGSAERMEEEIRKARRKQPRTAPSDKVARDLDVTSTTVDGIAVYDVKPKGASPDRHVVYLHGGSYTFEISPFHWRFIRDIARSSRAGFTVPIYTLAPEANAGQTVPAMADLVETAIKEHGAENVTLMGDSAGGGMALAVAQVLRDRGVQPNRTVLISPWLDVTLSEPQAKDIEPHDIMLTIDGLRHAGLAYAGPLDPKDPMVSPIFGDMTGLAPVDLYIGTYDIFFADIPQIVAAMEKGGAQLRVYEGPKLPHVYPILPIPEGRPARAEIVELVRR